MKLLKSILVLTLVLTNVAPALAATEGTNCVFLESNMSLSTGITSKFVEDVKSLQTFLVKLGYLNSSSVTGEFGSMTQDALKQFQLDNGIISSLTSSGAGEAGPKTRDFIANNTCGSSELSKISQSTNSQSSVPQSTASKFGYKIGASTKTNLKITKKGSEQVLRINFTPQEQDASIKELYVQIESTSTKKISSFIESIELSVDGKTISKTNGEDVFEEVEGSSKARLVKLIGNENIDVEKGENISLDVKIHPKKSALKSTPKEFILFVPDDALSIDFTDSKGSFLKNITWGSPDQESSFSIGKAKSTKPRRTVYMPEIPTEPTATSTDTTNTDTTPTVTRKPQLNWIKPDVGGFGEDIILRGSHFERSQKNRVKFVHIESGAVRISGVVASRDNQIHFRFPAAGADFERRNGRTVSGLEGNYRVSVITQAGESNWILYKVKK